MLTHKKETSPMRLLHIVGESRFGGAARIILRLGQIAQAEGWQVDILTTDPLFQEAVRQHGLGLVNLDVIRREIRPGMGSGRPLAPAPVSAPGAVPDRSHPHLQGRLCGAPGGAPGGRAGDCAHRPWLCDSTKTVRWFRACCTPRWNGSPRAGATGLFRSASFIAPGRSNWGCARPSASSRFLTASPKRRARTRPVARSSPPDGRGIWRLRGAEHGQAGGGQGPGISARSRRQAAAQRAPDSDCRLPATARRANGWNGSRSSAESPTA